MYDCRPSLPIEIELPGVSRIRCPNRDATFDKPSLSSWYNCFLSLTSVIYFLDPRESRVINRSMIGLDEARPKNKYLIRNLKSQLSLASEIPG